MLKSPIVGLVLCGLVSRGSAYSPPVPTYEYTMTANTQCGWTYGDDGDCGVAADQWVWDGPERFFEGVSRDDVEICKDICNSNFECAGFVFNAVESKCAFRRSVTCGLESHSDRDCYAKYIVPLDSYPPPPGIYGPGITAPTTDPDAATMSGAGSPSGDPADWEMGVDGTDIYKCAKDTDTCLVNSAGSRHTFTKAARPSISMVDAEVFSHSGGDGTWSFADSKAVFSSANTDHSFSFAAGAVNM